MFVYDEFDLLTQFNFLLLLIIMHIMKILFAIKHILMPYSALLYSTCLNPSNT